MLYCLDKVGGSGQHSFGKRHAQSENLSGGCQGLGEGRSGELFFNGYRVSVWEDEKVEMDGGNGCTALRIYLMPLKTVKILLNFVMYVLPHTQKASVQAIGLF